MDTSAPTQHTAGPRDWRRNGGTQHEWDNFLAMSPGSTGEELGPAITLVWIDAREAIIVRCVEDVPHIERIGSEIAVHHRATGPVRPDPDARDGGGWPPQTSGEPPRLEDAARFVEAVAQRLRRDDDLIVLGSGPVRQRLVRRIRELDDHDRVSRDIECQAAQRMTHRQLIACLRRALGDEPRRLTADEDLLGG